MNYLSKEQQKLFIGFKLCCSLAAAFANHACSTSSYGRSLQSSQVLPEGVGLVRLIHRRYTPISHTFEDNGTLSPLSSQYSKDLFAKELADKNADLKTLVDELNKYDRDPQTGQLLGDALYLGRIAAIAHGNLEVNALGFGYGLTRQWTFFAGVPLIDASVDARLSFDQSKNNALAIKERLGDLAFDELRDGLDKASQLDDSLAQVEIEKYGYQPVSNWSHRGLGDISMGLQWGHAQLVGKMIHDASYTTALTIPHGYRDDPSLLTDISLSQEYYSLGLKTDQMLREGFYSIKMGLEYKSNFTTEKEVRVPIGNELLIDKSQETRVTYSPGNDILATSQLELSYSMLSFAYGVGYNYHQQNSYDGSIPGNYAKLEEDSASYELYQVISSSLQTIESFRKKKFAYPFVLTASYHQPLKGKNKVYQSYFAIEITGFWTSNLATFDTKKPKKRQRRKRQR